MPSKQNIDKTKTKQKIPTDCYSIRTVTTPIIEQNPANGEEYKIPNQIKIPVIGLSQNKTLLNARKLPSCRTTSTNQ